MCLTDSEPTSNAHSDFLAFIITMPKRTAGNKTQSEIQARELLAKFRIALDNIPDAEVCLHKAVLIRNSHIKTCEFLKHAKAKRQRLE